MGVLRLRILPHRSARRFGVTRRRWLLATAATVIATAAVAGCGDDAPTPDTTVEVDVPAVYVAVIDHLVMGGDVPPKTLFIEPLAPTKVSLSDQAEIIQAFDENTSVRFVDEHEEAVDDEDPQPVRNDGVLVQVGQADAQPDYVSVTATRYVSLTDSETRCFTLAQTPNMPAVVLTSTAC